LILLQDFLSFDHCDLCLRLSAPGLAPRMTYEVWRIDLAPET